MLTEYSPVPKMVSILLSFTKIFLVEECLSVESHDRA